MKTIVAAMITCIALFGLSMGATQFLLAPAPDAEDELIEGEPPESEPTDQVAEEAKYGPQTVPVSFRPENVSVEAVVQMSDSIRRMEQQLSEREARVIKDEQRLKTLFGDLTREQQELRALGDGIDTKIKTLQQLTTSLAATLNDLDARKSELEALEKQTGADQQSQDTSLQDKVNSVKSWFEGLPPEQAADYLKDFANNGKLEFSAALLHKMPDRQKSKILGAMSDPVLVDQLIDALKTQPKKK